MPTMELTTILLLFLSAIVLGTYLFTKWTYSSWKRLGISQIEPTFPYGNSKPFVTNKEFFGDTFTRFYKHFKAKGLKGGGIYIFFKPVFVPVDLDLIKNILQKDFGHFVNHGGYTNKKLDPLSGHLFNLENEEWKNLRAKLTPTFTSAKMRMMFQTFIDCTLGLVDVLKESAAIHDPVDIKDVVSRFTTDIIGSCAFGIDCNSLKNPNSEFRKFGDRVFKPPSTLKRKLKATLVSLLPPAVMKMLQIKLMEQDMESFYMGVVKDTVNYREKNQVKRKDFMQLLLQLKNEGKVDDDDNNNATKNNQNSHSRQTLTMNELAAQCFVFFVAGFETSGTTMTFALLELAQNQEIQNKLRNDIEEVLTQHDGKLSYEAVMAMSYLDKVIQETLRRHSAAGGVTRVCNKTYKVPGTDYVLETGTRVHIPIHGIHSDPEYYPDPEKFDPERFTEENKSKRPTFSFLAFGEGPRICIGARFGLLQTKVGLLTIIRNFQITLNEKTKIPVKYKSGIIPSVEGGVWLNVTPINSN